MYRIFSLLMITITVAFVGCGTPSDVHLGERRFNRVNAEGDEIQAVVLEGRFWYSDPMTTMAAEGQMLWNFEMAKSLEAVRTATNEDELKLAKRQLDIIQSAKPAEPEKVLGSIINYSNRDFVCYVYADESKTRRLGRVILPPAPDPNGTVRPFYLPKGIQAHFVWTEHDQFVSQRTLDNPADIGWEDYMK